MKGLPIDRDILHGYRGGLPGEPKTDG
jgi:hypothetical protein